MALSGNGGWLFSFFFWAKKVHIFIWKHFFPQLLEIQNFPPVGKIEKSARKLAALPKFKDERIRNVNKREGVFVYLFSRQGDIFHFVCPWWPACSHGLSLLTCQDCNFRKLEDEWARPSSSFYCRLLVQQSLQKPYWFYNITVTFGTFKTPQCQRAPIGQTKIQSRGLAFMLIFLPSSHIFTLQCHNIILTKCY